MSEVVKAEEVKVERRVFMAGIVPCYNELFLGAALNITMPMMQEIVDQVEGEYTMQQVRNAIWMGQVHLCMAYNLPWSGEGEPDEKVMQEEITKHLMSPDGKKDFIGYAVLKPSGDSDCFIWHAYITKEYEGTNAFDQSFGWILKQAKGIGKTLPLGSKFMSCAVYREDMGKLLERKGFKKAYTVYRMPLVKE